MNNLYKLIAIGCASQVVGCASIVNGQNQSVSVETRQGPSLVSGANDLKTDESSKAPTAASNLSWEPIYIGGAGEVLSIDAGSINKNAPNIEYSELLLFKKPKPLPPPMDGIISMQSRIKVNCVEHTRLIIELLFTKSNGSTIFQNKSGLPLELPISNDPNMPDYISSNHLCNKKDIANVKH